MPTVREFIERLKFRQTKHRSLVWSLLVLTLAMLVLAVMLESRLSQRQLDAQRDEVAAQLSTIRYQLESTLANNLSLVNGLAAFISSYPDFTPSQYEQYARTAISRDPSLVNLAAAPDLVVRYVYPREGNEVVLGLDYMSRADQRESVLKVVQTGTMIIAGPIELVQGGGLAFVARAPVYVTDSNSEQRLWGIVSSPMLAATVYEMAGLNSVSPDLEVAIRGADDIMSGNVFFGSEEVFSHPGAVTMPISAGGSLWEIAAAPSPVMAAVYDSSTSIMRSVVFGAWLLLCILLVLRFRHVLHNEMLRGIIFRNERFLRAVETVSRVGGWRWSDGMFTEVSPQTRRIMVLSADAETIAMADFCHTLDSHSAELLAECIQHAALTASRIDQELELRRATGEAMWLHLKAEAHQLGKGTELIGAIQDITQQKQVDQLIEYQANYDLLTGLPNRALFQDRLQTALLQAKRRNTRIAVLFVDLDSFKSVNDNLGHDAGDELLIESARRIQSCVRSVDTVARYSGDEFVALLIDVHSAGVTSRIADNIVMAMRQPFMIDDHQVYCSASIGVSFYPDDGIEPDTLLIKADQAMYEVKKSGRNAWHFYTAAMQLESEQKHRLFNELVVAINSAQLEVYYQPVANARTGCIEGCEALVRWPRASGWVRPDVFIPVAEERGLVNRIDLFVLQHSIQFIRDLNTKLGRRISLSVNVSPRLLQLRDEDAQRWLRLLEQQRDIDITIEITERVLLDDLGHTSQVLQQLHNAGARIAIDDFGTGYSGLSYFSRFPVSAVKIDRSFVNDLGESSTPTTLVETILLLGQKLGIQVVAEGVENDRQADFLREHSCDYLQGYFIAPPLSEGDFVALVNK